jgi:hypothetical protein
MITFPGDNNKTDVSTQFSGGYGTMGASERYNSIDGDKISCTNIEAKTVTAGWVYAGNVSANQITTGSLTGIVVQSSSGNNKIVLDTGDYLNFYIGGDLKCQVRGTSAGSGGLSSSGDIVIPNNKSYLIASSGGYGGLSITGNNDLWLTMGSDNKFYVKSFDQQTNYFTVSGSVVYSSTHFESSDNYTRLNGHNLYLSDNDVSFWHDGSNNRNRDCITNGGAVLSWDHNNHWFHMPDGTDKSAIVSTSKGYKALYCIESPEVWFMDFCKSQLKEDIDPTFLQVTEGPMRFIKCADGWYQVWRRRKGHANKRFESKTRLQFIKNETFLRMAK